MQKIGIRPGKTTAHGGIDRATRLSSSVNGPGFYHAVAATFNASIRISSVRRALSAENSGVVFTV